MVKIKFYSVYGRSAPYSLLRTSLLLTSTSNHYTRVVAMSLL
jgi:hypothetical protein